MKRSVRSTGGLVGADRRGEEGAEREGEASDGSIHVSSLSRAHEVSTTVQTDFHDTYLHL